jgi:hypothetical protein
MALVELVTFDGSFERLGDSDHHVGAENPDVVDEQSAEKDAPSNDLIQMQQFHSGQRERETKYVVGDPMLKHIYDISKFILLQY